MARPISSGTITFGLVNVLQGGCVAPTGAETHCPAAPATRSV
jgi:hypothetical protein